jgi:4-hydroxybenzoate polyprenyltransferase
MSDITVPDPVPNPTREPAPTGEKSKVADAAALNWFDRTAPAWARPYGQLARFDRPIGAWLLLFPCWWSQTLAEVSAGRSYPNVWFLALFLIGAFVMRGAGCTHNDIIDREYDKRVARTASRPIPSGRVTVLQAFVFAIGLCLIGLLVLLQFNRFTVALGIASLALVAVYPFAKRYTHWAQLLLGLTFKWGALVGWAAVMGGLGWPPALLYAGAVLWTIGYDTIYAHQDAEDDAVLGLKSTALLFAEKTPMYVGGFYAAAWLLWFAAVSLVGASIITITALALVAGQMAWQVATLDITRPKNCLDRFRSNRFIGWIFFAGLVAEMLLVNVARAP